MLKTEVSKYARTLRLLWSRFGLPFTLGRRPAKADFGIVTEDHVHRSSGVHGEDAAELPAAQDCVCNRTPVRTKCLALAKGQVIGAAEDQVVADIGIGAGIFVLQVVRVLRADCCRGPS